MQTWHEYMYMLMMMIVMCASSMSVWLNAGSPEETAAKKRKTETKISKQAKTRKGDYDWLRLFTGEQGWCSGVSACLTTVWPGCDSDLVPLVGWDCCWFLFCSEGLNFSGNSFSPLSRKTNISKFQFDQNRWRRPTCTIKQAKADVALTLNIVIYINCIKKMFALFKIILVTGGLTLQSSKLWNVLMLSITSYHVW